MFQFNRSVPHTVLLCGLAPTNEGAANNIPESHSLGGKGENSDGSPGELQLQPLAALQTLYLTKSVAAVAFGKWHCAVVTTSGDLYTWGRGDQGVLGHGNQEDVWRPERVEFPDPDTAVQGVACGDTCTLAIDKRRKVHGWGSTAHHACGHLGNRRKDPVCSPEEVKALSGVEFVKVLACDTYGGAISTDGKFYTWGSGEFWRLGWEVKKESDDGKPTAVVSIVFPPGKTIDFGEDVRIVNGMLGPHHAGAVTDDGRLFCWGYNQAGACAIASSGLDGKKHMNFLPTLVKGLDDEKIIKVQGGRHFTVALAASGRVYSWGKGSQGQLGIGKTPLGMAKSPKMVKGSLSRAQIVDIACGYFHSVAVAEDGRCFTWGHGRFGQTGQGNRQDSHEPVELPDVTLPGEGSVMCGMYTTAVLASSMENIEGVMLEPAAEDIPLAPGIAVPHVDGVEDSNDDHRKSQVLEIQGTFQSLGVKSPLSSQTSETVFSSGMANTSQPPSMKAFEPVAGRESKDVNVKSAGGSGVAAMRLNGGIDQLEERAGGMADQVNRLSFQLDEKTRELDELREQEQQEIRRMLNEQKELETKLATAKADEEQVECLREGISTLTSVINDCVALNEKLTVCTTAVMASTHPEASYTDLLRLCNAEIDKIQREAEKLKTERLTNILKDDENHLLLERLVTMVIDSAKTKRAYTEKEAMLNAETARKETEFKKKHNTPPKMQSSPIPVTSPPSPGGSLPHVEKRRMSFGSPKIVTNSPKLASTIAPGSPKASSPTSRLQATVRSGKVRAMGAMNGVMNQGKRRTDSSPNRRSISPSSRNPNSPKTPESNRSPPGSRPVSAKMPAPMVRGASQQIARPSMKCKPCDSFPPCEHYATKEAMDAAISMKTKKARCKYCSLPPPCKHFEPAQPKELLFEGETNGGNVAKTDPHARDQCQSKCTVM